MADEEGVVPAGWYPDPLGLPQLRWWDNHAWTEHTSDARQPMVAHETVASAKLAYADDDIAPETRVDQLVDDAVVPPTSDAPHAEADPMLSLEAPVAELRSDEEVSPGLRYAQENPIADAPTSAPFLLDTSYDDLLGVPIAQPAAAEPAPTFGFEPAMAFATPSGGAEPSAGSLPAFAASNFSPSSFGNYTYTPPVDAETAQPLTRRAVLAENGLSINTGPVWIIAVMPVIMLVLAMMFLLAGNAGADSSLFAGLILGGSYLATVILAAIDQAMLKRMGHTRTANWDWAFLGAPVYLIARMSNVVRETGRGLRPFMTWSGFAIVLIASALMVPGIVLALAPGIFSDEAEKSIIDDAAALGGKVQATCPEVPPLLIGGSMTCDAVFPDRVNGDARVVVTLVRQNGWIDWRIDDWGVLSLER
ncbi:DUF2510 domain-containing protein [Salinibacterium sp. ZJ77]|uniref:DUF2510 domain-containing protein n=1 Tax=Salinibacterium sp. ZJ77 TaxID=2708337 RepID=UPI0014216289|nr:DUF2510 domain-containing protein [Salinibacterium sp. ZJ77]